MTILTFSTEELHLETPEIEGNIPSDFWSLTKLERLELSLSSSSLPTEIGALTNLETFACRDCLNNFPVPTELGNLSNLKELVLEDSFFHSSVPSELGKLSLLNSFFLSGSKAMTGDVIPSEVCALFRTGNLTSMTVSNGKSGSDSITCNCCTNDTNDKDLWYFRIVD